LDSSGPFTLVRFVQGREVELTYNTPLPSGGWSSANLVNMNGVQAQGLLGTSVGGSIIRIPTQPLLYEGQTIENATLTAQVLNMNGDLEASQQGSYLGLGSYVASLNLNAKSLSAGDYSVSTELYAGLPSGAIVQYGVEKLTIHPPLLMLQLIVYVVALASFVAVVHRFRRLKPRRRLRGASKPSRPRRRTRITRSRRKK